MFSDGGHHAVLISIVMPGWMMVFGTPNNDVGVVGKYAPPIFHRIADAEEFEGEQSGEMALDVNNYAGAMLEMLRAENDAERDAAYKLGMCGNAKMEELATMCYNMCTRDRHDNS